MRRLQVDSLLYLLLYKEKYGGACDGSLSEFTCCCIYNDKYGSDCDDGFSELTRCCIYYSTMINMAVTVMAVLVS